MLSLKLLRKVIDQPVVKVLPTQMSITSGGLDLKEPPIDGEDGNVVRAHTFVIVRLFILTSYAFT
jgi:hypothetical protein